MLLFTLLNKTLANLSPFNCQTVYTHWLLTIHPFCQCWACLHWVGRRKSTTVVFVFNTSYEVFNLLFEANFSRKQFTKFFAKDQQINTGEPLQKAEVRWWQTSGKNITTDQFTATLLHTGDTEVTVKWGRVQSKQIYSTSGSMGSSNGPASPNHGRTKSMKGNRKWYTVSKKEVSTHKLCLRHKVFTSTQCGFDRIIRQRLRKNKQTLKISTSPTGTNAGCVHTVYVLFSGKNPKTVSVLLKEKTPPVRSLTRF